VAWSRARVCGGGGPWRGGNGGCGEGAIAAPVTIGGAATVVKGEKSEVKKRPILDM
jgi:hypothetical protein